MTNNYLSEMEMGELINNQVAVGWVDNTYRDAITKLRNGCLDLTIAEFCVVSIKFNRQFRYSEDPEEFTYSNTINEQMNLAISHLNKTDSVHNWQTLWARPKLTKEFLKTLNCPYGDLISDYTTDPKWEGHLIGSIPLTTRQNWFKSVMTNVKQDGFDFIVTSKYWMGENKHPMLATIELIMKLKDLQIKYDRSLLLLPSHVVSASSFTVPVTEITDPDEVIFLESFTHLVYEIISGNFVGLSDYREFGVHPVLRTGSDELNYVVSVGAYIYNDVNETALLNMNIFTHEDGLAYCTANGLTVQLPKYWVDRKLISTSSVL